MRRGFSTLTARTGHSSRAEILGVSLINKSYREPSGSYNDHSPERSLADLTLCQSPLRGGEDKYFCQLWQSGNQRLATINIIISTPTIENLSINHHHLHHHIIHPPPGVYKYSYSSYHHSSSSSSTISIIHFHPTLMIVKAFEVG